MFGWRDVEKPGLRDNGFSEQKLSKDSRKFTVCGILTTSWLYFACTSNKKKSELSLSALFLWTSKEHSCKTHSIILLSCHIYLSITLSASNEVLLIYIKYHKAFPLCLVSYQKAKKTLINSHSHSFQQSQPQTELASYRQCQRNETAQTLRMEESGTISSKRQLCYCEHKPGIKREMKISSSGTGGGRSLLVHRALWPLRKPKGIHELWFGVWALYH